MIRLEIVKSDSDNVVLDEVLSHEKAIAVHFSPPCTHTNRIVRVDHNFSFLQTSKVHKRKTYVSLESLRR